jgi:hypothetical protein
MKKCSGCGKTFNSTISLSRHIRHCLILQCDFIAKERLKKSLLENNLAENQIESADNVEEKNYSSDKIKREIKKEPDGSLFVEPYSSLNLENI